MINDKLNDIDKLLNDEGIFDEYINSLESSNSSIPFGLENRILNGIKLKTISKSDKIIKSNKFVDILKIAACTIVAICIWNVSLSSNKVYATNKNIKRSEFYTKFENVIENINDFFMTPIRIERGEK